MNNLLFYLFKYMLYFILFHFLIISCCDAGLLFEAIIELTGCDEYIILDDLKLSEEGLHFVPYEKEDTLIFKNIDRDSAVFYYAQFNLKNDKLYAGEECTYYNTNYKSVDFGSLEDSTHQKFSLNFKTKIRLNSEDLPIEETTIILLVNYGYRDALVINHKKNPRFKTIKLIEQTFENVYANQDGTNNVVYFNKKIGVVAFKDFEGTMWVLEN